MAAAIAGMEAGDLPLEVRTWKADNNITEEEIGSAASALARAQRDFVNAADPVDSFERALDRRDFLDLRYPVRQFLFAAIGQVFCAAWFTAVREVSRVNEDSPAAAGMADFTATVQGFYGYKQLPDAQARALAALQLRNDVLQSRLQTVYAECVKLQEQLRQSQTQPAVAEKPKSLLRRILCL
jgi:hypothetical protein